MAARAGLGSGFNAEAATELSIAHSRGRLFGELHSGAAMIAYFKLVLVTS